MPLTLAGTPMIVPTRELIAWIERTIPVEDACPWAVQTWPGGAIAYREIAAPLGLRMPVELKINRYWQPCGATRFGYGHFLCSGDDLATIQDAADGADGQSTQPITLHLSSDGLASQEVVEKQVTLLKAMPLANVPVDERPAGTTSLYLLTVVDDRYFWQSTPTPDLQIPNYGDNLSVEDGGLGATWPGWFDILGALIGTDGLNTPVGTDAIDDAYLYPDPSMNAIGASAAAVLDAIGFNVGKKLVMGLQLPVLQGFDDALKALQTDDLAFPDRTLLAGGDGFAETL